MSKPFRKGDKVRFKATSNFTRDLLYPYFKDGVIYTVDTMVGTTQVRVTMRERGGFAPTIQHFTLVNTKPFVKEDWL